MVPGSSPPRQSINKQDYIRAVFICVCFVGMVAAISLDKASIELASACVVVLFHVFRVVSVDQLFDAIKARALLVIVGAMGVAAAFRTAGIAHFLAVVLSQNAPTLGPHLMR